MSVTQRLTREMFVIMSASLGSVGPVVLLLACATCRPERLRLDLRGAQAHHEQPAARPPGRAGRGPAPLVGARALADQLAEPAAERAETGEADQVADLGHGQVAAPEQVGGPLHPALGQ